MKSSIFQKLTRKIWRISVLTVLENRWFHKFILISSDLSKMSIFFTWFSQNFDIHNFSFELYLKGGIALDIFRSFDRDCFRSCPVVKFEMTHKILLNIFFRFNIWQHFSFSTDDFWKFVRVLYFRSCQNFFYILYFQ